MFALRRLATTVASSSLPPKLHNLSPVSQASTAAPLCALAQPQIPAAAVACSQDVPSLSLVPINSKIQSKVVPYVWDDSFNTKRLAAASSVSDSSVGGEKNTKSTGDNDSSRPSRDAFDKTVGKILNDINSFFVRKADYTIYDANVLFENRMNGRVARNVLEFKTEMNYLRIWGHLRYPFVRMNVVEFKKDESEAKVTIHWRIRIWSWLRLVAYYLPKRLFRMENMINHSAIWKEGIAQVWVGSEAKVTRIVVDDKWENKMGSESKVESIKKKLERLKQAPMPAPA